MKLKTLIASALIAGTLFSCGNENQTPAPSPAAAAPTNSNTTESGPEKNNSQASSNQDSPKTSTSVNSEYAFILGSWKGNLRDKKLTVVIESIQGNVATGYNIAGSNRRPVSGTIMEDDRQGDGECGGNQSAYKIILREPGDDKWDGFFTLYFTDCPEMDENQDKVVGHSYNAYGEWKAFSGKLSGDVYLSK